MNNLILNYILKNFVKNFFIVTIIFYCFGVILNLFEEVEFLKILKKIYLFLYFSRVYLFQALLLNFYHLLFLFRVFGSCLNLGIVKIC